MNQGQPFIPQKIKLRDQKKIPKASVTNELAEALNWLLPPFVGGQVHGMARSSPIFLCKVVDPPDNKPAFTNEEYFLSISLITNDSTGIDPAVDNIAAVTIAEIDPQFEQHQIIVATNPGDILTHSHSIDVGTPVFVKTLIDRSGTMRHLIVGAAGGGEKFNAQYQGMVHIEVSQYEDGGAFLFAHDNIP